MAELIPIAHIRSDFPEKFGIPRQSNVVRGLKASIVFEPAFRQPEAVRGLEAFSHIWLLWGFSAVKPGAFSPTVRPPRLGGNARLGVFATRSPFRPNPVGLSCVGLQSIEQHATLGSVLHVQGADLMDGSPIYDIKPYLPYADCLPEARGGLAAEAPAAVLQVVLAPGCHTGLPPDQETVLLQVLALDPRPAYQDAPERVYGMVFAGREIRFCVEGNVLTVLEVL